MAFLTATLYRDSLPSETQLTPRHVQHPDKIYCHFCKRGYYLDYEQQMAPNKPEFLRLLLAAAQEVVNQTHVSQHDERFVTLPGILPATGSEAAKSA